MAIHPNLEIGNIWRVFNLNPLAAMKLCCESFEASQGCYNERLYEYIAFLTAYVERLSRSPNDRAEFMDAYRSLGRAYAPKEHRLALNACQFMMGVRTKSRLYEQARVYSKAVDYYLSTEMPIAEIALDIKDKGGLYNLLKSLDDEHDDNSVGENGRTLHPDRNYPANEASNEDGASTVPDGGVGTASPSANSLIEKEDLGPEHNTRWLRRRFKPADDIVVEAGGLRHELLEYAVGTKVWALLEIKPGERAWKRIAVERLELDRSAFSYNR